MNRVTQEAGRGRKRYAYALEVRNVEGNWFLSVDWPCYANRKAAEKRLMDLRHGKPDMHYRIRKLEFVSEVKP